MIKEIERKYASGYLALVVLPVLIILNGWWLVTSAMAESVMSVVISVLVGINCL